MANAPTPPAGPTPGAAVIKVITLGTDQYVIAKLDTNIPSADYSIDIAINPASGPTVAGCFAKVNCGSLTIIV